VLALDTGASVTTINVNHLLRVGHDPSAFPANVPVATGTGVLHVPRLPFMALTALGQTRPNFPIIAHTLPAATLVDGVLGLNFFRDSILTLDFQKGELTLQNGAGASP
jgi:hypothetical protein